jgi:hypothetical protein
MSSSQSTSSGTVDLDQLASDYYASLDGNSTATTASRTGSTQTNSTTGSVQPATQTQPRPATSNASNRHDDPIENIAPDDTRHGPAPGERRDSGSA